MATIKSGSRLDDKKYLCLYFNMKLPLTLISNTIAPIVDIILSLMGQDAL
jgi:hypothetical protein